MIEAREKQTFSFAGGLNIHQSSTSSSKGSNTLITGQQQTTFSSEFTFCLPLDLDRPPSAQHSVRDLEKQIEEGTGDLIQLKRTRNSLLNISTRVPPEILGAIFSWSAIGPFQRGFPTSQRVAERVL